MESNNGPSENLKKKDYIIDLPKYVTIFSGFTSAFTSILAILKHSSQPYLQKMYNEAFKNWRNYWDKGIPEIKDYILKELYISHLGGKLNSATEALTRNQKNTGIFASIAFITAIVFVFFGYIYFSERKERLRQKTIDQYF